MLVNIADIPFAIGTILFGLASLRQLRRLYRVKKTGGFSLSGQHIKLAAILCYLVGYIMTRLPISFTICLLESSITIGTIYLICKYRKIRIFKPSENVI